MRLLLTFWKKSMLLFLISNKLAVFYPLPIVPTWPPMLPIICSMMPPFIILTP